VRLGTGDRFGDLALFVFGHAIGLLSVLIVVIPASGWLIQQAHIQA
jgi:hypothetical protein